MTDAPNSPEPVAQRLQDHLEQHHGICLKASEWDAAAAALAPHLSPSGDAERDRLKAAYIAGAEAVHYGLIYSNPYRDPDFGEAAGDYADEVLHQDAIAHREAGE